MIAEPVSSAADGVLAMLQKLPDLIARTAKRRPQADALRYRGHSLSYAALNGLVESCARGLLEHGLQRGERVAVYLEKRFETVGALFGASAAGCVFVPINPLLKAHQVRYILRDCNVRVLVTSAIRLAGLAEILGDCPDLKAVVVVGDAAHGSNKAAPAVDILPWQRLLDAGSASDRSAPRVIDMDMAAIIYTSGSTGMPKGVVLSHRNMLAGAESVSTYLENDENDRILAVLPFSFDAGFSQLTTAFAVGATAVLMDYLLPRDVVRLCAKERITGITAVPPLWIQLSGLDWPAEAAETIRYFANTGGRMPRTTLAKLRTLFPAAKPYLMYGLTEAFRSTYLDPAEIDRRPDSIGKAVPSAEILVIGADGRPSDPGQPGELVHRGAFVAMGYWNDPERTAERFRPAPGRSEGVCIPEMAVWSGDTVRTDEDGFLYFVGRRDEMIKTSGYRVSPTELEEVVYSSRLVGEAVAIGVPHAALGQAIVVVATAPNSEDLDVDGILAKCRRELPSFMVPHRVIGRPHLPRNPNGKIDRKRIAVELETLFEEADG